MDGCVAGYKSKRGEKKKQMVATPIYNLVLEGMMMCREWPSLRYFYQMRGFHRGKALTTF